MKKFLRVADIQTSDLLYFDPAFIERCYKFCEDRNIDCLPALDAPGKIFLRDKTQHVFKEEPIADAQKVSSATNIFAPEMLERFRKHPLLMVFTGNELTGVMHFSDYGKPVVSAYLYELFYALEKALKTMLLAQKMGNDEMLAYFQHCIETATDKDEKEYYKRRRRSFEKNEQKNRLLPPLQTFYLGDLIELADYKGIILLSSDLVELRNMIMHAHELVDMENPYTDDLIYKFESFETFFDRVVRLHQDYKRVNNWLAFQPSNKDPQ